jgi:amidophosphoribosyltransferase
MAYFGLHALQHRGQESAGIAAADGNYITATKERGLVTQVFNESTLATLDGHIAIGHTRYSTSGGSSSWDAAQPHLSAIGETIIALAHNGTLVNTNRLRAQLLDLGVTFRSSTDSEVAAKLIGYYTEQTHHIREGIQHTMELIEGAYAMVLINSESLYAFRDPNGIRPLCLGELPDGRGWVVASESCGLDIVGAEYLRDIEPGEVVRISADGLVSEQAIPKRRRALCIFEYVYFARPDSVLDGLSVYAARAAMGRKLFQEAPVDADVIMGVPDSGTPAGIGYARASGIPFTECVVKNRYVGRTFIQPTQTLRQRGIRLKLNPLPEVIAGQRLVVIDDSIVRGNTSRQLVQMLRDAGAAEVHLRITSPPVAWPCFYGIDTDTQDQLIAATKSIEEIAAFVGADSLAYLSLEGLRECCQADHDGFCEACFSGEYPVRLAEQLNSRSFCGQLEPTFWPDEKAGMEPLF